MNNHIAAHHRHVTYDQTITSEIRKKYVRNEYDEKQWQIQAMRKYKQLTYDNHIADITQTFAQISRDILRDVLQQLTIIQIDASTFNRTYNMLLTWKNVYLIESADELIEEAYGKMRGFINYINTYIMDLSEKNGYTYYPQMYFHEDTGVLSWLRLSRTQHCNHKK